MRWVVHASTTLVSNVRDPKIAMSWSSTRCCDAAKVNRALQGVDELAMVEDAQQFN